jgi:hypothetical protein
VALSDALSERIVAHRKPMIKLKSTKQKDRGFEQILKFLGATVLPAAKDAPVNQFYDTRIIERLKKGS